MALRLLAPRRIRLGTIFALLVLVTTAPLVLLATHLIGRLWQQQRQMVDRQNIERARAILVAIDQEVQQTIAALEVLAALDPLDTDDFRSFHALASQAAAIHPGWTAVRLVNRRSEVLVDTSVPPGGASTLASDEWVRRVIETGEPAVSNLVRVPGEGGGFFIAIGVPVVRGGQIRYALGARLSASVFSEILRRQRTPGESVVSLLDANRIIIARSRREARYVGERPTADFAEQSYVMAEGAWRTTLLEGEGAYGALSRSDVTGWTVGLAVPLMTVDGPILSSLQSITGVGVAVLFVGVLAALVISRRVVAAQVAAVDAARRLARGERMELPASPITDIDDLAQGLKEAAAILEQRLREREAAEAGLAQAAARLQTALGAERAARAERERNEAHLRVTLNSIGDAVIATDADGRITMLNPVAETLTGWSEREAVGRPIDEIFRTVDEATGDTLPSVRDRVLALGPAQNRKAVLLARDGQAVAVDDTTAPIRAADDALVGSVVVFRDVTAQRDAERDRAAMLESEQHARLAAEALNRAKDDFMATVSHELRTPLNAIFGWVSMLRMGMLDAAGRVKALEVIERNTRIQVQLVEDLLDMARVIRGTLHLDLQPVDAAAVADAAVDALGPAASERGIAFHVHTPKGLALVSADPSRLQQIVWNLLANSVKFSRPGDAVHLEVAVEGAEAVLRIRDTGGGIEPGFLPYVFDRFRQERSDPSREHAGLGIGLALVRHLVELHGGSVRAESRGKGTGATFTVRLPLLPQHGTDLLSPPALAAAAAPSVSTPLDSLDVLVVDDDTDGRDLVVKTLEAAGARVRSASSVAEAWTHIHTRVPHIVITDIAMPTATGFDLVRGLRADPRTAALPVIALTAYAREEDRARALALGFDAHLGKPFLPGVLVSLVAGVVRQ